MNRYKVSLKRECIEYYEVEINADGGYEAANKAEKIPEEWKLLESKTTVKCIGSQLKKEGIRE